MKIAHTGDTHIRMAHKRWLTLDRALRDMVAQMREHEPDLIVHSGDLGEPNPTAQDLYCQAVFLQDLADIAPTIVVAGNHDSIEHLQVLARIETLHPLWISTSPDTLALADGQILQLSDLGLDEIESVDLVIHALPWPAKGNLLARLPEMPSSEESDQVARQLLLDIFRGFKAERETAGYEGPSILLGHLEVHGAKMDSGQPVAGPGLKVGVEDLKETGADGALLGHIHARQRLSDETHVVYSGSPCRLTWGEAGAEGKGWGLLDFDPAMARHDAPVVYEWVDVPSPRLWTVEAEWESNLDNIGENIVWQFVATKMDRDEAGALQKLAEPDDELRFRYHVPEDQREAAKEQAEKEIASIWPGKRENVTVEAIVIPTDKARAPEIARLDDPSQMFDRWIAAEGHDLPEERRARLQLLMNQVLQEVAS